LLVAHVGHWIWQLLYMAPIILIAVGLLAAEILHRRDPERYAREAEEESERGLDEILNG